MSKYLIRRGRGFDNFFDTAFDGFFRPMFYEDKPEGMNTDIRETENGYRMEIEMPGFDKSEIDLTLENGYLTIAARKEEKEDDSYIRKERKMQCSRSYYVGDAITEEDIKAKYASGVLAIEFPKDKEAKKIEAKKISID